MESCVKFVQDFASPFDCILFDLDDTLYPTTTGIAQALKRNIEVFLVEKCGFTESKASSLRVELFKTYGSTLAGLRALGYDIKADDYHSFVHGRLPYDLIKSDPNLRNLLLSIPQRKIIFTNSDKIHAIEVLERLGIRDCFDQIICFETMNPNLLNSTQPDEFPVLLKPSPCAMKIALDVAKINACRTLFIDDNVHNIASGKALGLHTVLVGKTEKTKEADYALESMRNLSLVVPEIWKFKKGDDATFGDQGLKRTKSELDASLATTTVGA